MVPPQLDFSKKGLPSPSRPLERTFSPLNAALKLGEELLLLPAGRPKMVGPLEPALSVKFCYDSPSDLGIWSRPNTLEKSAFMSKSKSKETKNLWVPDSSWPIPSWLFQYVSTILFFIFSHSWDDDPIDFTLIEIGVLNPPQNILDTRII